MERERKRKVGEQFCFRRKMIPVYFLVWGREAV